MRRSARPTDEILSAIGPENFEDVLGDWPTWARRDQLPEEVLEPAALWNTWLVLGGRGAGKTRTGAEWIRHKALAKPPVSSSPARHIALVGPTLGEARAVMIEGVSGLLAIHNSCERPRFYPSRNLLEWPNGSTAAIYSAEEPDSLRGPQFDAAWCDELAKWRHLEHTWQMLQFALRLGRHPQVVVTTTPRPVPLLLQLMEDKNTLVTRATTYDNACFLAASFLTSIEEQYGGTRLGRQEIEGELITDNPDALFSRDLIEKFRVRKVPEMERIVVAVDPPVTSRKKSNACGIVCAGLGEDGRAYVLDDATVEKATPMQWARQAITLYHSRSADRLVAEVNQGGDMVAVIIHELDPAIAFKPVHATRAKRLRAEPVAALYEQGRVSHAGVFRQLEDEMANFEHHAGNRQKSPDRVDALVWALTELMLNRRAAVPRVTIV